MVTAVPVARYMPSQGGREERGEGKGKEKRKGGKEVEGRRNRGKGGRCT